MTPSSLAFPEDEKRRETMLMSNTDRPARLYFAANGFRVLATGDHVACAATGERIALDELRYWSVALQQPYANAAVAMAAMAG